ncbi:NADH-quinone oxidoreductase subunit NuoF [Anoxynatronum buryatiense]|uniref:NADH-quinone oxidoreductase subunit F n=1 Tax=Anoxynatronum buryatiense TaxID=489973 RepID=A0AA46AK78_9CLOT|nr:NADH-quinone oxidoreductase subunit NuoF [Anoxynatronum buryatiense]SMP68146.1 NADH-quinone oxidoreductase subunit F [Anoxynatronum buryatiense]
MRIVVGQGSCGIAAGAGKVSVAFQEALSQTDAPVSLELTGCCGTCYLEPVVDVYDSHHEKTTFVLVTPEMVDEIIDFTLTGKQPAAGHLMSEEDLTAQAKQKKVALRNAGSINPEDINDYLAIDGYKAIEKALKTMTPVQVIEEIKISGLRGRGGAGFPTWFKWNAAYQQKETPKYMVCNADEGDPGAFMDRSILEGDPHGVIEGMMIGGYAMGASEGIFYVRAEYPLAIKRLEKAIEQAREKGLLGKNIMDSGFDFDLWIKAGAGAFVCGEETALIASLEGERGMPRLKPPFPAQKGFWQKPTNINNVETLANVPWIFRNGGAAFAAMGTEKSKGTKVFALTGKIKKGGLVEIPMGLTLREVIYDIGGGILDDKGFKAVQMGGPSGGCIPAHLLDTPVDYESITQTGAIMGSGGMVVMDETTCMVEMARFFLDFTRKESCGKCIHCRMGTKRMLEILTRITEGKGKDGDIELLEELCERVKEGSLCALGGTAPNPVLTTLKYFRHEYEAHIHDRKCPSHQCKQLLTYTISETACKKCGICAKNCPTDAITGSKTEVYVIDQALCIQCGKCKTVCPFKAVDVD